MTFKKIFCVLLAVMLFLCGCEGVDGSSSSNFPSPPPKVEFKEMRGIWISYYDYDFRGLSKEEVERNVEAMVENISSAGFNNIFLHTRANADSIYPSKTFPFSAALGGSDPGYDLLKIFIDAAHRKNILIHAWINPYRISSNSGDVNSLSTEHIARKWAIDPEKSENVISYNERLYFNPSSLEVQKLIIDGVKEIIDNYDIDGIHFDDYFYPTSATDFDMTAYEKYKSGCELPLSHGKWRIASVSSLVQSVHTLTKNANIVFGVSPSAHLDAQYLQKNGYADITSWMQSDDYVDYITPQIYWGFEYPTDVYKFENMLNSWVSLKRHPSVKLYIGLAFYKSGTEDHGGEWLNNHDIISRQVLLCREKNVDGHFIFSYNTFFSDNGANTVERMNYLSVIK